MSETHIPTVRKPGEIVFSFLLLLFSAVALILATQIPASSLLSGPKTLPLMASAVLVVTAIVNTRGVWALAPHSNDETFAQQLTPPVLLNFFLLGAGYIVLLSWLGFIVASLVYLFVSILYLHRQGWLLALFVSLNSLAVIYVIFRLTFKVILPEGVLGL